MGSIHQTWFLLFCNSFFVIQNSWKYFNTNHLFDTQLSSTSFIGKFTLYTQIYFSQLPVMWSKNLRSFHNKHDIVA